VFEVTNAAAPRAGTLIPESFDLQVGSSDYFVHPNATKHMAEYVMNRMALGRTANPDFPITSLAGALDSAQTSGALSLGRNFLTVGRWELGVAINPTRNVLYHALYRP
jgi:hypothetical protein